MTDKKVSRKASSNNSNIQVIKIVKVLVLLLIVYIIYTLLVKLFKKQFNKDECMVKHNSNKCVCFNERLMNLYIEYLNNPTSLENKIKYNPNIIKNIYNIDSKSKLINIYDSTEIRRNVRNILRECHPDKNRHITNENIKNFTAFITQMINSVNK